MRRAGLGTAFENGAATSFLQELACGSRPSAGAWRLPASPSAVSAPGPSSSGASPIAGSASPTAARRGCRGRPADRNPDRPAPRPDPAARAGAVARGRQSRRWRRQNRRPARVEPDASLVWPGPLATPESLVAFRPAARPRDVPGARSALNPQPAVRPEPAAPNSPPEPSGRPAARSWPPPWPPLGDPRSAGLGSAERLTATPPVPADSTAVVRAGRSSQALEQFDWPEATVEPHVPAVADRLRSPAPPPRPRDVSRDVIATREIQIRSRREIAARRRGSRGRLPGSRVLAAPESARRPAALEATDPATGSPRAFAAPEIAAREVTASREPASRHRLATRPLSAAAGRRPRF